MALREDKTKADLLRRTLASSANAAGVCPDPHILAAWADHSLDAEETAHYELHFSQCAHCREQLAAMVRAGVPVTLGARPRSFQWVWPWTWFVLVPATTAILIAAVFIVRRPANRVAERQPLVAMQAPSQPPMNTAIPPSAPAENKTSTTAQPVAREASPPAEATAARSRSSAESTEQSTTPKYSVPVQAGREQASAPQEPAEREPRAKSIPDLPVSGRTDAVLDKKSEPLALAQPAAATSPAPAEQPQSADAAGRGTLTQTVTVESEVQPVTTKAPAPPNRLVAGNGAANSFGVSASATRSNAANSTLYSAKEAVDLESTADRDARTIVRSPNPQVLWRVSSGRYVERSTDAGATWRAQWTGVNAHVVAGSAPSADTCWLVGNGGIVLLTKDGTRWHTLEPPANTDFVAVSASNAASATITSTDGRKFETSDGGKHWIPAP